MKRMCTGRGLVIALIGLAGLTAAMILLITGRSGPEAEAQEAAQEAEPSPVAVESVADQIRRLAIEGEDPQGAVAAALQYLAEHPEVTVERQRVHYELAATQFRAGDEAAALVTFRQIVAQYGNAAFDQAAGDYKVDDALYFISLLEDGAGTPEGRAAAIAAKEALVAQFPTSNFRPRALIELGSMYIENDEDRKPALGMARLRTLAQQHPDSEFAPAAIRTINAWLLDPRAWSDEQPEAECLATVKANVGLLAAKYAGSIDTRQARQDLLWYYDTQSHQEEATALARNIIAIYSTADRELAGDALWCAAMALFNPEPALVAENRALAIAALTRHVADRPGAECPPYALYRLSLALAEESVLDGGARDPNLLYEAGTVAEGLRTRYAGTDAEPEALRWSNLVLLSKAVAPTKADRELNYPIVYATIDDLLARFPDSDQTLLAHEEVLWHFENERFDYATGEIWAKRLIERFPNTRQAAVALIDLAEMGVQTRRDFAGAYGLIQQALDWAYATEDWDLAGMAMFSRGRQLIWEQRYDDARQALTELLAFIDEYPEAEAWRIQAEVDSAASYIEEGSALDSDNKPVEANACLMKAVEAFSALVEKYPDDAGWTPYLKFEIGLAHLLAGDKASAKTAFLRLAADHADNCWTWAAFNHMDLGVERPARPKTVRIVEDER